MRRAANRVRSYLPLAFLALAACAGRMASVESEPTPEPPTEADFYGTYDLYMGGQPMLEGQPAPFTATWSEDRFVVLQQGHETIRTGISIDPVKQEIRIWDPNTSDIACGSEGIYVYEDDGETITMTAVADPCANRAASADGARLIRQ
ncbi:MAG: hypothetical protein PVF05_02500 [Gemmatimonadales bacterium]